MHDYQQNTTGHAKQALDKYQAATVEHAKAVLAASVIDSAPGRLAYHVGAMEVILSNMITLVEQLSTGGEQ